MCGRTSMFLPQPELEVQFDAQVAAGVEYQPRYNIASGASLEVITNEAPDVINQYHWGLIPFWVDESDEGLINARSETAFFMPSSAGTSATGSAIRSRIRD